MRSALLSHTLVLVVGAAITLVTLKQCADQQGAQPKIPPKVQRDLDSVAFTAPTHAATIDSLKQVAAQKEQDRRVAQQKAAATEQLAKTEHARADSIAAVAQDAEGWQAAYEERSDEAEHWQQAAADNEDALTAEQAAHAATKLALTKETDRRVHLEAVTIPGLEHTIATLDQPCRLLKYIPCPNRTVTGILFAGAGYYAGTKVHP